MAVVDFHPITAAGIAGQVAEQGFAIAGVATAVEGLAVMADAVVCDLRLADRSGPDAVAFLVERGHRVLATCGAAGPEEILDVISRGARGFIAKTAPVPLFMRAIRGVVDFSYFVSSEIAHLMLADADLRPLGENDLSATERSVLRRFEKGDTHAEAAAALGLPSAAVSEALAGAWDKARARRALLRPTHRERELMALVRGGCSHKEAAAHMSITTNTVAGYLKSIKGKYLAVHPGAPESIAPLTAARRWADEGSA